jgi:predicted enzyme related to lactoylglutathione lyase
MTRFWYCIAAFAFAACAAASPLGPDGSPGRTLPGKFIWFDLATEDPAGARVFYGSVFGWKFREAGGPSSYTLIEQAGGKVGGLFKATRPPGATVGARWLSVLSVPDAGKAARYVRQAGGQVVLAPATVPGRGTHALFKDPEGAFFGVLAAADGDPPDSPVADGDVFWLDLFSRNPAKAAEFYAGLAGYEVSAPERDAARPRWILATGGYARAGITVLKSRDTKPGWLPYVLVQDVPATLRRAQEAGGRIVVAPRADVLDGNVAVIADPNGGLIGVVNWVVPAGAEGGAR